jgi:hypothetical protein
MTETPRDADEIERRLDSVFQEESALVRVTNNPLILFALGTAPYTGGIASLLSNHALKRQELRLRTFLLDFARYVDEHWQELERKIDQDFIASEDFVTVLEDSLSEVGRTADERKVEFLRAYILNSASIIRPDVSWRDVFRTYLSQLSGSHLVCLRYVFVSQGEEAESDRYGSVRTHNIPVTVDAFNANHPNMSRTLARVCFADLANMSLLVDWRSLGNSGVFQSEYCITENGLRFMRFLEGKWQQP